MVGNRATPSCSTLAQWDNPRWVRSLEAILLRYLKPSMVTWAHIPSSRDRRGQLVVARACRTSSEH